MKKRESYSYVSGVLDLASCSRPLLSADADPSHFFPPGKTPYPSQTESMRATREFFAAPGERLMVKLIPTAGGKSPDAAASAKAWTAAGGVAVIICPNKELQQQYRGDFGDGELSVVVGGVEFACKSFAGLSCGSLRSREGCLERRTKSDGASLPTCACPYKTHILEAAGRSRQRPLCFNPHSFDAFRKNPVVSGYLPDGDGLLIVDEAHLLEDQLRDFLSLSVDLGLVESMIDLDPGLGGFAGEFFFDSSGVTNEDGLPATLVKDSQTVYLVCLRDSLGAAAARMAEAIKNSDYDALLAMVPPPPGLASLSGSDFSEFYQRQKESLEATRDRLDFVIATTGETHWVAELTTSPSTEGGGGGGGGGGGASYSHSAEWAGEGLSPGERAAGGQDGGAFSRSAALAASEAASKSASESAPGAPSDQPPMFLRLRPTLIPHSYLSRFFRGFSKIILMSGTFFGLHMKLLGLSPREAKDPFSECRVFQVDSRIDLARRRVYVDTINGVDVSAGGGGGGSGGGGGGNLEASFVHFAEYLATRVASKLPGEKGIIHVSSKRQAKILTAIGNQVARRLAREGGGRRVCEFITPTERSPWKDTYRSFKQRSPGGTSLFLVAARRYEGIDLRDDLARICVMAKAPFPNIRDTMTVALDQLFPGYTAITTIVSFIQGMNRAVRTPDDWALNICLDTTMSQLLRRHAAELPTYVRESLVTPDYADWASVWEPPAAGDINDDTEITDAKARENSATSEGSARRTGAGAGQKQEQEQEKEREKERRRRQGKLTGGRGSLV